MTELITVDAGGALTVTDVATGNNNAIALTTSSGDITGLATVNAGSGAVTLNSAGAIVDDSDASTVVTGGCLLRMQRERSRSIRP